MNKYDDSLEKNLNNNYSTMPNPANYNGSNSNNLPPIDFHNRNGKYRRSTHTAKDVSALGVRDFSKPAHARKPILNATQDMESLASRKQEVARRIQAIRANQQAATQQMDPFAQKPVNIPTQQMSIPMENTQSILTKQLDANFNGATQIMPTQQMNVGANSTQAISLDYLNQSAPTVSFNVPMSVQEVNLSSSFQSPLIGSTLTLAIPSKNKKAKTSSHGVSKNAWIGGGAALIILAGAGIGLGLTLSKHKSSSSYGVDEAKLDFYNQCLKEIESDTFLTPENKQALLLVIKDRIQKAQSIDQVQNIYDSSKGLILQEKQNQVLSSIEKLLGDDYVLDQGQKDGIVQEARHRVEGMTDNKEFQAYLTASNPSIKAVLDNLLDIAKYDAIRRLETKISELGLKDQTLVDGAFAQIEAQLKTATSYDELKRMEITQWNSVSFNLLPVYKTALIAEFEALINAGNDLPAEKASMIARIQQIFADANDIDQVQQKIWEAQNVIVPNRIGEITLKIGEIAKVIKASNLPEADKQALLTFAADTLAGDDSSNFVQIMNAKIATLTSLTADEKTQLVASLTTAASTTTYVLSVFQSIFENRRKSELDKLIPFIRARRQSQADETKLIIHTAAILAIATDDEELDFEIAKAKEYLLEQFRTAENAAYFTLVNSTKLDATTRTSLVVKAATMLSAVVDLSEFEAAVAKIDEALLKAVQDDEIDKFMVKVNALTLLDAAVREKVIIAAKLAIHGAISPSTIFSVMVSQEDYLLTTYKNEMINKFLAVVKPVTSISSSVKTQLINNAKVDIGAATNPAAVTTKYNQANDELNKAILSQRKSEAIAAFEALVNLNRQILSNADRIRLLGETRIAINNAQSYDEIASISLTAKANLLAQIKIGAIDAITKQVQASSLTDVMKQRLIRETADAINRATSAGSVNEQMAQFSLRFANADLKASKANAIATFAAAVNASSLPAVVKTTLIDNIRTSVNLATTAEDMMTAIDLANAAFLAEVKSAANAAFGALVDATTLDATIKQQLKNDEVHLVDLATTPEDVEAKLTAAKQQLIAVTFTANKQLAFATFASNVKGITILEQDVQTKLVDEAQVAINTALDDSELISVISEMNNHLTAAVRAAAILSFNNDVSATALSATEKKTLTTNAEASMNGATTASDVMAKYREARAALDTANLHSDQLSSIAAFNKMVDATTLSQTIKNGLEVDARIAITGTTTGAALKAAIDKAEAAFLDEVKKNEIKKYETAVQAASIFLGIRQQLINDAKTEIGAATSLSEIASRVRAANAALARENLVDGKKLAISSYTDAVEATSLSRAIKDQLISDALVAIGGVNSPTSLTMVVNEADDKLWKLIRQAAIDDFTKAVHDSALELAKQNQLINEVTREINTKQNDIDVESALQDAKAKLLLEVKTAAYNRFASLVDSTQLSDVIKNRLLRNAEVRIHSATRVDEVKNKYAEAKSDLDKAIYSLKQSDIIAFTNIVKATMLSESAKQLLINKVNAIIKKEVSGAGINNALKLVYVQLLNQLKEWSLQEVANLVNGQVSFLSIISPDALASMTKIIDDINSKYIQFIHDDAGTYGYAIKASINDFYNNLWIAMRKTALANFARVINEGNYAIAEKTKLINNFNDQLQSLEAHVKITDAQGMVTSLHWDDYNLLLRTTSVDLWTKIKSIINTFKDIVKPELVDQSDLDKLVTAMAKASDADDLTQILKAAHIWTAIKTEVIKMFSDTINATTLSDDVKKQIIDDATTVLNSAQNIGVLAYRFNELFANALSRFKVVVKAEFKIMLSSIPFLTDAERDAKYSNFEKLIDDKNIATIKQVIAKKDDEYHALLVSVQKMAISNFEAEVHKSSLPANVQSALTTNASTVLTAATTFDALMQKYNALERDFLDKFGQKLISDFSGAVAAAPLLTSASQRTLINNLQSEIHNARDCDAIKAKFDAANIALQNEVKQYAMTLLTKLATTYILTDSQKTPILEAAKNEINSATTLTQVKTIYDAKCLAMAKLLDIGIFTHGVTTTALEDAMKSTLITNATNAINSSTTQAELETALNNANDNLLTEAKNAVIAKFSGVVNTLSISGTIQSKIIADATKIVGEAASVYELTDKENEINAMLLAEFKKVAITTFGVEVDANPTLSGVISLTLKNNAKTNINHASDLTGVERQITVAQDALLTEVKNSALETFVAAVHTTSLAADMQKALIDHATTSIQGAANVNALLAAIDAATAELGHASLSTMQILLVTRFTNDVESTLIDTTAKSKLISDATLAIKGASDLAASQGALIAAEAKLLAAAISAADATFTQNIAAASLVPATVLDSIKVVGKAYIASSTNVSEVAKRFASVNLDLIVAMKEAAINKVIADEQALGMTEDQIKILVDKLVSSIDDSSAVGDLVTRISNFQTGDLLSESKKILIDKYADLIKNSLLPNDRQTSLNNAIASQINGASSLEDLKTKMGNIYSANFAEIKQAYISKFASDVTNAPYLDDATKTTLKNLSATLINGATNLVELEQKIKEAYDNFLSKFKVANIDQFTHEVNQDATLGLIDKNDLINAATRNINDAQSIDDVTAQFSVAKINWLQVIRQNAINKITSEAHQSLLPTDRQNAIITSATNTFTSLATIAEVGTKLAEAEAALLVEAKQAAINAFNLAVDNVSQLDDATKAALKNEGLSSINGASNFNDLKLKSDIMNDNLLMLVRKAAIAKFTNDMHKTMLSDSTQTALIGIAIAALEKAQNASDVFEIISTGTEFLKSVRQIIIEEFKTMISISILSSGQQTSLATDAASLINGAANVNDILVKLSAAQEKALSLIKTTVINKLALEIDAMNLPANVKESTKEVIKTAVAKISDLNGITEQIDAISNLKFVGIQKAALEKFAETIRSSLLPESVQDALIANAETEINGATNQVALDAKVTALDAMLLGKIKQLISDQVSHLMSLISSKLWTESILGVALNARVAINAATSISEANKEFANMESRLIEMIKQNAINQFTHDFNQSRLETIMSVSATNMFNGATYKISVIDGLKSALASRQTIVEINAAYIDAFNQMMNTYRAQAKLMYANSISSSTNAALNDDKKQQIISAGESAIDALSTPAEINKFLDDHDAHIATYLKTEAEKLTEYRNAKIAEATGMMVILTGNPDQAKIQQTLLDGIRQASSITAIDAVLSVWWTHNQQLAFEYYRSEMLHLIESTNWDAYFKHAVYTLVKDELERQVSYDSFAHMHAVYEQLSSIVKGYASAHPQAQPQP